MAPSALQVGDTVELPQVRVQKKIKSMQVSQHALDLLNVPDVYDGLQRVSGKSCP